MIFSHFSWKLADRYFGVNFSTHSLQNSRKKERKRFCWLTSALVVASFNSLVIVTTFSCNAFCSSTLCRSPISCLWRAFSSSSCLRIRLICCSRSFCREVFSIPNFRLKGENQSVNHSVKIDLSIGDSIHISELISPSSFWTSSAVLTDPVSINVFSNAAISSFNVSHELLNSKIEWACCFSSWRSLNSDRRVSSFSWFYQI